MRKVPVNLGDRSYDIIIEGGSLPRTGEFVRKCVKGTHKACVATTETVAGLYLKTVDDSLSDAGFEVTKIIIPDGEDQKTLTTYESMITKLIEAQFERKSVVVPLGGGVIGDIAGFVAATLLRGIPFVHIPTTIVAQIDSSIGGKVAVNHPMGKNLVGCFYQPLGVWIDTRVLDTLEHREVVSGMAEAVKHAVIRDEEYFSFLEDNLESIIQLEASDEIMERFIAWNCHIKAGIVSADERESGIRAILNYGHTVGHAIETVTGYNRYRHGEAVILGMIAGGRIAVRKGLMREEDFNRQNCLLERVGINRDVAGIIMQEVYQAMMYDKKVSEGHIRFVLPAGIGSVGVYDDVTRDEIEDGLKYMFNYVCG